jgi:hypothetical protein
VLGLLLALVLVLPSGRVPLRQTFVPKSVRGAGVTIPLEGREGRQQATVY